MNTDISRLKDICAKVEDTLAKRQEDLTGSAAVLAATVGPLATAHRLAELAQEFYLLAGVE